MVMDEKIATMWEDLSEDVKRVVRREALRAEVSVATIVGRWVVEKCQLIGKEEGEA
jgi:hypothetical protein